METDLVLIIVNSAVSAIAMIMSVVMGKKGASTKTLEQIGIEANAKAQKYITKQCKKYKLSNETKSETNESGNTSTAENLENNN